MQTATLFRLNPSKKLKSPSRHPLVTRSWVTSLFIALFCCTLMPRLASAQGDDGGKFDGAIWTFSMVPHDKNLEKRNGQFRVHGNDLYQRTNIEELGKDRKIGRKTQVKAVRNKKGKIVGPEHTTIEFFDLQSNNAKYTGMKGKVVLKKNKQGEWSGRFVDQDGLHWNFKCSRKQE